MRKREVIETDGKRLDLLILEVLLDIRELLPETPQPKSTGIKEEVEVIPHKKRGRPKKIK